MLKRLTMAIACCWTLAAIAPAQSAVDLRDASAAAMPATVTILLDSTDDAGPLNDHTWRPLTERAELDLWIRSQLSPQDRPLRSGFAVAPDLIITIDVPVGKRDVQVVTANNRKLKGEVLLRDEVTGLAAIRLATDQPLENALTINPDPPAVGLPVAVSWMRGGKYLTVDGAMIASDAGTIAATSGYTQQIDTDVSVEAVGAPIVDTEGKVVGVVIVSDEGHLLSLPVGPIQRLITAAGQENPSDLRRGRIGVTLGQSADRQKAIIVAVTAGSPAEQAGLQAGDQIIKIADHDIRSELDVLAAVAMWRAGDQVTIVVQRGEETIEKTLQLAAPPQRVPLAASGNRSRPKQPLKMQKGDPVEPGEVIGDLDNVEVPALPRRFAPRRNVPSPADRDSLEREVRRLSELIEQMNQKLGEQEDNDQ